MTRLVDMPWYPFQMPVIPPMDHDLIVVAITITVVTMVSPYLCLSDGHSLQFNSLRQIC